MMEITIVGMGVNIQTVTAEGLEAVSSAKMIFGSERLLEQTAYLSIPSYEGYTADKILSVMKREGVDSAVLLVSGDTGFYSAAQSIQKAAPDVNVRLIPGISTLNYFFAKLGTAWQDAKLISCHARENNVVDAVRRNQKTFLLTGGNRHIISQQLTEYGFGRLNVYAGENLGTKTEKIYKTTVESLVKSDALTVLLVENPDCNSRVSFGIKDESFIRSEVPMTKAEVRAVTMSKLCPKPCDICMDIGCGTGSVTVELALAAYEGRVFAIDKNETAVELTRQNCRKFSVGNVTAVCGSVPQALADIPSADVVFIGGSSGSIQDIFDEILKKNPYTRIAVNAISLETLSEACAAFKKHSIKAEIVQISVAKAKKLGGHNLMMGQNPVYIISGGNDE